jgi:aspartate aminotransferase
VHTRQQVKDLVEVAEYEDLWIISDEIYGRLLYDGKEHVSPAHFPEGRRRTFLVNGPSKTYAMTGWRLGFLAGPEEYVQAAYRIQSQVTGNTSTPGQWAATEAFQNDHSPALHKMLTAFDARRRLALDLLAAVPQIKPTRPSGAFYIVFDVRPILQARGIDDVQMAERLLEDVRLALVPGSPFALPGFLRISYAASEAAIREGIRRLAKWISG